MEASEMVRYWCAQVVGAILGALVLLLIASGKADYSVAENGLGQNGYGEGYLGEYGLVSAFLFEVVATFLFVTVILGATRSVGGAGAFAGLAIGLTLAAIHLVGINVTGVSVNPARSIGPALFVGGGALGSLWLFIVAPMIGAAIAGLVDAAGVTEPDPVENS
jgi:aquaporin Z